MAALARNLPEPVRRFVARPLAGLAERVVDRRPGSHRGAQAAVILRWIAGPPEAARALVVRLGTSGRVLQRTRRRLVRLALWCGMPDEARTVLATMPDDRAPELEIVRAQWALERGSYTDALEHARAALEGGWPGARRYVAMVESRAAILRPDWAPDLRRETERLAHVRGTSTPGRILHVVSRALPYHQIGYTLRTQSVARCQRDVGLDPHVATTGNFPRNVGVRDAPAEWSVEGIPHVALAPSFADAGFHDRLVTQSARGALAVIDRLRPAVLQPASNHVQAQIALAAGRAAGIPVVYEARGFHEESWASHPEHDEATALATERYRWSHAAESRVMQAADAVVTLSETMREEIISRGCAPDRVHVVPNAVDVEQFRPVPRSDDLAAELGIEPGETVIGYISSLNSYEGLDTLLRAGASLRADGRRVRLLLVGDGPDAARLRELGRELGLADGTLLMPGRVPHAAILRYYSLIDVFVVPRTNDRVARLVTPLKPYEAMAMERALLVSDIPALREIVTPGETGLTFRPEDPAHLAEVLGTLIDDPDLRAHLGRQAREWVVGSRTWAHNGPRYRALFEQLGVA